MVRITTQSATIAEWDAVQAALTGGGDGRSCQCVWPLLPNKDWNATTAEQRSAILHNQLKDGPPPASRAPDSPTMNR